MGGTLLIFRAMRLHILSDLHLSVAPLAHPQTDADLVILAGDIARPEAAIAWARGFDKPVLFVAGNHEFYDGSLDRTLAELRRLSAGTQIRVLERDELVIGGLRFLGTTLWTDFRLDPDAATRATAARTAQKLVRDFSRIRIDENTDAAFSPAHSALQFRRNADWLHTRLEAPFDGPTVVITHHAPSPRSIHPRFAGSPLNACFVSQAEWLLAGRAARLWIHGHTHDSFDYELHGTRVVCNPRGYSPPGRPENPHFDPGFVVEVS